MNSKGGYWFRSTLFEADESEELETNPRMFGRELAIWLEDKLHSFGYKTDVFPEDWGWCIECQVKPFGLYLGCGNLWDYETTKPGDPVPVSKDILWHVYPFAEVSLLKRVFGKIDTNESLGRLEVELQKILTEEPEITIVRQP